MRCGDTLAPSAASPAWFNKALPGCPNFPSMNH
jgi:hypothetical protein